MEDWYEIDSIWHWFWNGKMHVAFSKPYPSSEISKYKILLIDKSDGDVILDTANLYYSDTNYNYCVFDLPPKGHITNVEIQLINSEDVIFASLSAYDDFRAAPALLDTPSFSSYDANENKIYINKNDPNADEIFIRLRRKDQSWGEIYDVDERINFMDSYFGIGDGMFMPFENSYRTLSAYDTDTVSVGIVEGYDSTYKAKIDNAITMINNAIGKAFLYYTSSNPTIKIRIGTRSSLGLDEYTYGTWEHVYDDYPNNSRILSTTIYLRTDTKITTFQELALEELLQCLNNVVDTWENPNSVHFEAGQLIPLEYIPTLDAKKVKVANTVLWPGITGSLAAWLTNSPITFRTTSNQFRVPDGLLEPNTQYEVQFWSRTYESNDFSKFSSWHTFTTGDSSNVGKYGLRIFERTGSSLSLLADNNPFEYSRKEYVLAFKEKGASSFLETYSTQQIFTFINLRYGFPYIFKASNYFSGSTRGEQYRDWTQEFEIWTAPSDYSVSIIPASTSIVVTWTGLYSEQYRPDLTVYVQYNYNTVLSKKIYDAPIDGSVTLTGLQPNTSYTLNISTYKRIYEDDLNTHVFGTFKTIDFQTTQLERPTEWQWYPYEIDAFNNHGDITTLTYQRWNEFVDKIAEFEAYYYGEGGYRTDLNIAKMTSSDKVLTATKFNQARFAIGSMYPTGITEKSPGDVVYGSYFITLSNSLNNIYKP